MLKFYFYKKPIKYKMQNTFGIVGILSKFVLWMIINSHSNRKYNTQLSSYQYYTPKEQVMQKTSIIFYYFKFPLSMNRLFWFMTTKILINCFEVSYLFVPLILTCMYIHLFMNYFKATDDQNNFIVFLFQC